MLYYIQHALVPGNMYILAIFGLFPGGSVVKVSACNAGDVGSIPGSGRSPGEGRKLLTIKILISN